MSKYHLIWSSLTPFISNTSFTVSNPQICPVYSSQSLQKVQTEKKRVQLSQQLINKELEIFILIKKQEKGKTIVFYFKRVSPSFSNVSMNYQSFLNYMSTVITLLPFPCMSINYLAHLLVIFNRCALHIRDSQE